MAADEPRMNRWGKVYLVGAGPGDPQLLTLRGKRCLEQADVVVYDYLANPVLLEHAPEGAERIYVGRRDRGAYQEQHDVNHLLIGKARQGKVVVRLKGGDPFVFGRGGEEAEAVAEAGIPFEVVPGVTSAVAVPAYAGIPVTHRTLASTVAFVTGHEEFAGHRGTPHARRQATRNTGGIDSMGDTFASADGGRYTQRYCGEGETGADGTADDYRGGTGRSSSRAIELV